MENQLQCIGCGAILQSENPSLPGYLPSSVLEKKKDDDLFYCQRCFKLRHYNILEKTVTSSDYFYEVLNKISQEKAIVVHVVDLFDLNATFLPKIQRFAGNNPVLVVGNKVDLFPTSVKEDRLVQRLKTYSQQMKLKVADVKVISAKKKSHIDELMQWIEANRNGRDVYFVGVANVGKSTIINSMLKALGEKEEIITTSAFPGTTLGVIAIPFEDSGALIDTPGIVNEQQMENLLTPKEWKLAFPTKRIKPKVYQIQEKQTLLFGGLARLDYLSGDKNSFVIYMNNLLPIHRRKIEGSDAFYDKHVGDLLTPPTKETKANFPSLVGRTLTLDQPTDLVFPGIGWVSIKKPAKVRAFVPKGTLLEVRSPLI